MAKLFPSAAGVFAPRLLNYWAAVLRRAVGPGAVRYTLPGLGLVAAGIALNLRVAWPSCPPLREGLRPHREPFRFDTLRRFVIRSLHCPGHGCSGWPSCWRPDLHGGNAMLVLSRKG
jgi:hypothetical protein